MVDTLGGEDLEEEVEEDERSTSFTSDKDEVDYWKKRTTLFKRLWKESKEELEEFQSSSRDLETELEAQLDQSEAKEREATSQCQKIGRENENLRRQLTSLRSETDRQIAALAEDLTSVSKTREDLTNYVREMEQKNDDLERSKRHMISSLEDFEQRLNVALERNAFLESELEEKDHLQATIQRLKDESKDLRLEMSIKGHPGHPSPTGHLNTSSHQNLPGHQNPSTHSGLSPPSNLPPQPKPSAQNLSQKHTSSPPSASSALPSDNATNDNATSDNATSDSSTALQRLSLNTSAKQQQQQRPQQLGLTPNSRMVAMSLVGDLLQKVNALEARLATYRNHVRDKEANPGSGRASVSSPTRPGGLGGSAGHETADKAVKAKVTETAKDNLLSPGNVTSTVLTVIRPKENGTEEDRV